MTMMTMTIDDDDDDDEAEEEDHDVGDRILQYGSTNEFPTSHGVPRSFQQPRLTFSPRSHATCWRREPGLDHAGAVGAGLRFDDISFRTTTQTLPF